VTKKPMSTRRSWSKDEIRALKTMVKENVIANEIAQKLERTAAAVYRKAGILGVSLHAARKRRSKAKKASGRTALRSGADLTSGNARK
jgi:hypothetical protein